jgi:hypothetical protein
MHELTIHDLDAELAEQLPARELMGSAIAIARSSTTSVNIVAVQVASNNALTTATAVNFFSLF